ncbi:MAG: hypothetical protein ACMXYF_02805 [Candidatus Woesearchaeota archaeon]
MLFIPIFLLLISLGAQFYQYQTTGEIIERSITLKGGTVVTIQTDSPLDLEPIFLEQFPENELVVRDLLDRGRTVGYTFESDAPQDEFVALIVEQYSVSQEDLSVQSIQPSLSERFFLQILTALLAAFVFMSIIVYITYRSLVPAGIIILAVITDIVIAVGLFDLTSQRLGVGGLAAFLMIIGYSVDTNILLTNKMLKLGEIPLYDRFTQAARTGLMMSGTTVIALSLGLFFTNSEIIFQIMLVLLFGLLADIINTWITNAGLLRWYLEKKGEKK